MPDRPVIVRILHPDAGPAAGPATRWLAAERLVQAERHRAAFLRAGAAEVAILRGPPDDTPFGVRLRRIVEADRPEGLVVLGSGAIPLATDRDRRELVSAAARDDRSALTNNRFSGDVIAIACAGALATVPDLPGDNALPRWLAEVAGYRVADLRTRWRLEVDVDGPLDLLLLGASGPDGLDLAGVRDRFDGLRSVAADRRAELVLAGRVSTRSLGWAERRVPARVRALVEERGLRASTPLAQSDAPSGPRRPVRPPASLLGIHLDDAGPGALGSILARLGDAAIVDTRVLLAHRLGADESAWPAPEDRYASDLLLADRVADPWLRALTAAARDATIPVVLGGHSLVGPGVRLLLGSRRIRRLRWT